MRRTNVLISMRVFDKVYALANRMFRGNVSLALESVLVDYFDLNQEQKEGAENETIA